MRKIVLVTFILKLLIVGNIFAQKPNVILILTDDQGYGDLACHGNPFIKTPNLDALYNQSVRFTNFHVGTTCSPTRAMLMTGKNNNKVGVWHTINGREILNKDEKTMPEFFKEAGYQTAIFGKWHLGDNYPFRPQDRGFNEVLVLGGGGIGQTPDYWGNDYFGDTYLRNGKPEKFKEYCDDVWFGEAMRFMGQNLNTPFFCYIPTNVAHGPYNVSANYSKQYENNPNVPNPAFNGMISKIDENVGKLMQYLKSSGLDKKTIIVFMTDNGTAAGASFDKSEYTQLGFNANMRGQKGSAYEGGHRVPFFLYNPLIENIPKDIKTLASGMDVLPTLLDLCKINTIYSFQGVSLFPLLKGEKIKDRVLVADTQRGEYLIKNNSNSVMTQEWRLVNGKELYNMEKDPEQRQNLAIENTGIVNSLNMEYEKWWKDISIQKSDYQRVIVGSSKQKEVCLTSHDLHLEKGSPAWNQNMVKKELGSNGFWAIETAKRGIYKFELRRFPREAKSQIPEKYVNAKIKIDDKPYETVINDKKEKVVFKLKLPKGYHQIETYFSDNQGKSIEAAYVYVK